MHLLPSSSAYIDMTSGKPVRLIARFSLPLIVGNLFQQLYTFVDAIIVGKFIGVNAFAAVGCSDWIIWFLNAIPRDCSNAFCIAASISIGNRDKDQFRKIAANAVLFGGGLSVVVAGGFLIGLDPLLHLLHVPQAIYADARSYLLIIILCIPFSIAFHLTCALLRAAGNSNITFYGMAASTLINIALDLLFVLVFRWGVAGAAFATLLAQASAMTVALLAARNNPLLRIRREDWGLDRAIMGNIVKLWTPMMLNSVIIAIGGVYSQRAVNSIGEYFTAGIEAGNKVFGLIEAIIMAIQTSASVFVGQNLGARQPDRIRSGMARIVPFSLLITGVMILLVWLFGGEVINIFLSSNDPALYAAAHAAGLRYCLILVSGMVILTPMYLYRAALQTLGHPNYAMVAGFLQMAARVLTIAGLSSVLHEAAIYLAEILAWLVSLPMVAIPFVLYVRRLCRAQSAREQLQEPQNPA